MSIFSLYFQLGFDHIADLAGYDHILFLIALCAVYLLYEWKQVIVLVTAFTIGHSVTLALSTLNLILVPSALIEFVIPLTIFITAIVNIIYKKDKYSKKIHYFKYLMALFFGLIHGMGFSNYLKSLLGIEEDIIAPLFAFNIGLEIGQIVIVTVILFLSYLFVSVLKVIKREWNLVVSGAALGVSLVLMIERFIDLIN